MSGNSFINILVVDDEQDICELVSDILSDDGYTTQTASSYGDAITAINSKAFQLVILDVWLGEGDRDGLRLLQYIKEQNTIIPVIMMSGHGTINTAVVAIQQGAYDFIEKPFEPSRLLISVSKALESASLQHENATLKVRAKVTDFVLGNSPNVREINSFIERVAPLNGRCLIVGHKCSDKEDIAHKIHNASPRKYAQFCSINCLQCEPQYLELELFGSEITVSDQLQIRRGLFEKANNGTLFIDNIDVIPADLQNKLLTTFISRSFIRIGGIHSATLPLNSRIIFGTSINLEDKVSHDEFNRELYYQIGVNKVSILPLSKRINDIPILMQYYLNQLSLIRSSPKIVIDLKAEKILKSYSWPNDMIELRSVVDWIFSHVTAKTDNRYSSCVDTITVKQSDLPSSVTGIPPEQTDATQFNRSDTIFNLEIKDAKEQFEREYYVAQLKKYAGNIQRVSKIIGMDRSALYRRLKRLQIK